MGDFCPGLESVHVVLLRNFEYIFYGTSLKVPVPWGEQNCGKGHVLFV